jgi:hypothetical protein
MAMRMRVAVIALALPVLGGTRCAVFPIVQSGPEPRVANCALIEEDTPALYVCGGKVYTASQLDAIRHGNQPAQ